MRNGENRPSPAVDALQTHKICVLRSIAGMLLLEDGGIGISSSHEVPSHGSRCVSGTSLGIYFVVVKCASIPPTATLLHTTSHHATSPHAIVLHAMLFHAKSFYTRTLEHYIALLQLTPRQSKRHHSARHYFTLRPSTKRYS